MPSTALRKRKAGLDTERLKEAILPAGKAAAIALVSGFAAAKMPLVGAVGGAIGVLAGSYRKNAMMTLMGAAMLAGVGSDLANYLESLKTEVEAGRMSEMTLKEKLKGYIEEAKSKMPMGKKKSETATTETTLSGIADEFAALDRMSDQMIAQALENRAAQPTDISFA